MSWRLGGSGERGWVVFFWTGLLRFASLRAAFGRLFAFGYLRFASVPFGRLTGFIGINRSGEVAGGYGEWDAWWGALEMWEKDGDHEWLE